VQRRVRSADMFRVASATPEFNSRYSYVKIPPAFP
jgi:hypothetical protein